MSAIKSNAQFVNYEGKSFIKLIPGYFVSSSFNISWTLNRVRKGHGKPGKSLNFRISFSRPGKSWNLGVGYGKSWKMMFIKTYKIIFFFFFFAKKIVKTFPK